MDHGKYPTGVKISNTQMQSIILERDDFHGDWNYTICPRTEALTT